MDGVAREGAGAPRPGHLSDSVAGSYCTRTGSANRLGARPAPMSVRGRPGPGRAPRVSGPLARPCSGRAFLGQGPSPSLH